MRTVGAGLLDAAGVLDAASRSAVLAFEIRFSLEGGRRGDVLAPESPRAERSAALDRRARSAFGGDAARRTTPPDRCLRTEINLPASAAMPSITVLKSAWPVTTASNCISHSA